MKNRKTALIHFLNNQLKTSTGSIGIMCGHYQLVPDNNILIPGIYQEIKNVSLKNELKTDPYSSEFPMETFLAGLHLLKANPQSKLISLVNDWQKVPKNDPDNKDPNVFRKHYYEKDEVPKIYSDLISKNGFTDDVFLKPSSECRVFKSKLHFSESRLRNKFDTKFRSTCSLKNGCAQEFVPFLVELEKSGIKNLVSFIPATCQRPTCEGIHFVKKHLGLHINIWTIYIYQTTNKSVFWNNVWIFKNGEHEEYFE